MPKKNDFGYFTEGPSKSEELKQEIINDYLKSNWRFDRNKKGYLLLAPSGEMYPFDFNFDFNLYTEFEEEVFNLDVFRERLEANMLYRLIKSIPEVNKECLVNKCNEFYRKIRRKG